MLLLSGCYWGHEGTVTLINRSESPVHYRLLLVPDIRSGAAADTVVAADQVSVLEAGRLAVTDLNNLHQPGDALAGFASLLTLLPERLPGFPPCQHWLPSLIQPPFDANERVLWKHATAPPTRCM